MHKSSLRGDIYGILPGECERGGENTIRTNRPAIIVSNEDINKGNYNYMVVFLTTRPKKDEKTHITIRSAGRTSTALCEQITTVSAEQLDKYVGSCTAKEMEAIDRACMLALGIDDADWRNEQERNSEKILEEQLIEARAKADTIMEMYNELIEKTLDR